jgi:hypothetical protein
VEDRPWWLRDFKSVLGEHGFPFLQVNFINLLAPNNLSFVFSKNKKKEIVSPRQIQNQTISISAT